VPSNETEALTTVKTPNGLEWVKRRGGELPDLWEIDYLDHLFAGGPGALVYSSNWITNEEISALLKQRPGTILVHLSDENTNRKGKLDRARSEAFAEVYHRARAVFRQHVLDPICTPPNTYFMPLGYMKGMLSAPPPAPGADTSARSRQYLWSFVGNARSRDRRKMLRRFRKLKGDGAETASATSAEMAQLYADSLFVPVGVGHSNHDCFRIYEACACGAIPIICCSEKQRRVTFGPMQDLAPLPWVFIRSWKDARHAIEELSASGSLEEIRTRCAKWLPLAMQKTRATYLALG